MKIEKLILENKIKMNCYVISKDQEAIVIDPGFEKEKIQKYVSDNNLHVVAILLTHTHFDHICALDCFDVPIYVNKKEMVRITGDQYEPLLKRIAKDELEIDFDLRKLNYITFEDNEQLEIKSFKINSVFTPGHSLGHSAFMIEHSLFSGDCVFYETIGKTSFEFGGDEKLQESSVVKLINSFKDDVILYPGHGKNTTIEHEKNNNDFYKMFSLTNNDWNIVCDC